MNLKTVFFAQTSPWLTLIWKTFFSAVPRRKCIKKINSSSPWIDKDLVLDDLIYPAEEVKGESGSCPAQGHAGAKKGKVQDSRKGEDRDHKNCDTHLLYNTSATLALRDSSTEPAPLTPVDCWLSPRLQDCVSINVTMFDVDVTSTWHICICHFKDFNFLPF